jgi:hypothetical protein
MKELTRLNVADLLAVRQWLQMWTNSTTIQVEHVRMASDSMTEVDRELWARLISGNTPWGVLESTVRFEDANFEKTLELLRSSDPTSCQENLEPEKPE